MDSGMLNGVYEGIIRIVIVVVIFIALLIGGCSYFAYKTHTLNQQLEKERNDRVNTSPR
jgi:hypothetical protein